MADARSTCASRTTRTRSPSCAALLALQRAYELAGAADELMAADQRGRGGRAATAAPPSWRPDSDELLFWAGLALAHAGDLDAGVDAVRRAVAVHAGWPRCSTACPRSSRPRARRCARRCDARQRSPGSFAGFTDTGSSRSSAVRMIRFCSTVCAAG